MWDCKSDWEDSDDPNQKGIAYWWWRGLWHHNVSSPFGLPVLGAPPDALHLGHEVAAVKPGLVGSNRLAVAHCMRMAFRIHTCTTHLQLTQTPLSILASALRMAPEEALRQWRASQSGLQKRKCVESRADSGGRLERQTGVGE